MKKIVLVSTFISLHCFLFCQTSFTFNGNGNWTDSFNWMNHSIPPAVLPAGSGIYISPAAGDSCILNSIQTIAPGASLIVTSGNFIIVSGIYNFPCVVIDNLVWMSKNLDVVTYANGDTIPQVTDPAIWHTLTTGAWCYYNNNPANGAVYGKIYNWYAVTDPRRLAPNGWHVASSPEWNAMVTYLGGEPIAGGKLKDTQFWTSPNTGATNSTGFTARPGGSRYINGVFGASLIAGYWWTSTEFNTTNAWFWNLTNEDAAAYFGPGSKITGFSVRCVKD